MVQSMLLEIYGCKVDYPTDQSKLYIRDQCSLLTLAASKMLFTALFCQLIKISFFVFVFVFFFFHI